MKNKIFENKLSKTIFTQVFVVLLIFTVSFLLFFGILEFIFSSFSWQPFDFIYRLLYPIYQNKTVVMMFVWMIGCVIIFVYYLYRSLNYTNVLMRASNDLVGADDKWISLPNELSSIEKQMNEMKQKAISNAKSASLNEQRKNDLIVYLAHDIKTPLTSIIGYLSLLHDEDSISKKTKKKYLNIILDKSYRLENLINELFDIARYNSENIVLDMGVLDIHLMLEQIIEEFYPLAKAQNKSIKFMKDEQIKVSGDSLRLARVFSNILKNAVNYSFDDSVIGIDLYKENNDAVIQITNSGNTIPSFQLDKLFDKFYRVDSSRTSKTGGSGLGLAIAKDIVLLHHGSITVSSENQVTIFTIRLPI